MLIKKGRLAKDGTCGCIDITEGYKFLGDYETYEHCSISYIKCFSDVIVKHDNIDGEIHLKKGTYKYEL